MIVGYSSIDLSMQDGGPRPIYKSEIEVIKDVKQLLN